MNEEKIVREWMERERESTLRECSGDKRDAQTYLIADANSDCGTNLPHEELARISAEVLGL